MNIEERLDPGLQTPAHRPANMNGTMFVGCWLCPGWVALQQQPSDLSPVGLCASHTEELRSEA